MNDQGLGERVTALETRVKNELASREWVGGQLSNIREAAIRTENAIGMLSQQVSQVARQIEGVYATQTEMMKQRADREVQEHEARMASLRDQTFLNLVRDKWQPIVGFVTACLTVLALLATLFWNYLKAGGAVVEPPRGAEVTHAISHSHR